MDTRWTSLGPLELSDTALVALVAAVLTFLTGLGKGVWTVVRFVLDGHTTKERTREAEVKATLDAKNVEIAELRQMVRELSRERRQGRQR